MRLVYLHGANATPTSFNFLRQNLDPNLDARAVALSYQSADGFFNNLQKMQAVVAELDDVFFVAHSLGGIYALHLADRFKEKTLGAVTISTPYGGSQSASVAQVLLPMYNPQLMRDIYPGSGPVSQGHAIKPPCPWTNVVSVGGGSSLMMAANDGVVTDASMRYRAADMNLVDVNANHYEIVMSHDTLAVVEEEIRRARPRSSAHYECLARQEGGV